MKRLIVPVFVGCLLMLACKTTNVPPPLVPVIQAGEPIAADCGAPAVRDLATHLLDDVASALMATGDWRQALSAVAARAGSDGSAAVKCALGELLAQSSNQLAMRARMEKDAVDRTQLEHDRALTWLGEHPDPGTPRATNEQGRTNMVRAKLRVTSIAANAAWNSAKHDNSTVTLVPVQDEANKTWQKYTPGGEFKLSINNPDALAFFQLGETYFIDFSKAPQTEAEEKTPPAAA